MVYTCQYLQFGATTLLTDAPLAVPGIGKILCDNTQIMPPIFLNLVDTRNGDIWDLRFVSCLGEFYQVESVKRKRIHAQEGDVFNAWYQKRGTSGGHNCLVMTPFILKEDGSEGFFRPTEKFVDFTVLPAKGNSVVDTDAMDKAEVTAIVHKTLPEFDTTEESIRPYGFNKLLITVTTSQVVFSKIFVYFGVGQQKDNKITVKKGESCYALAVFRMQTTKEESTHSLPVEFAGILGPEWALAVRKAIKETVENKNGEISEQLSLDQIKMMKPDALSKLESSIEKRLKKLQELKSSITSAKK